MDKPWVLYVGNFGAPNENAAGKRVYGNALVFEKLGFQVELLGKTSQSVSAVEIEGHPDIRFNSFPAYRVYEVWKFITYWKEFISRAKRKPDLVIWYGSPSLACFVHALLCYCRRNGIAVVADVVDWLSAKGGNILFNLVKSVDTYLKNAVFSKQSDAIIVISTYLANYYKSVQKQVIVVPPLVEAYHQNTTRNEHLNICYAGIPFRPGRKRIGKDETKDRLDIVVSAACKACASGSILTLDIYGLDRNQYIDAYPEQHTELDDASGFVRFHGRVPMEEAQRATARADFTVLIRDVNRVTTAGFPTKVVESLTFGTPVITTRTSDLESYITDGKNGYFVEADSLELSERFSQLAEMPSDAIASMKDYCYMDQQFVPNRYIESFGHLVNSLCGGTDIVKEQK